QWQAEGSLDAAKRANQTWKKMLNDYELPPIDKGIDEALCEFIAQKKAAVPDSNF
ncbi:trimethylamine methyltransferase family protein, partial [Gammaproteobacteria bacterium]|nr:trimethylamine methyltransferase family protein [Gammaproteobacteria bacterium]